MEPAIRVRGRLTMPTVNTSATVEETAATVRTWVARSGLTAQAIAKRAGVSSSTLHRVLHNQVDPSLGTLNEIAIACGLNLDLATHPLGDPAAAAAARTQLEDDYEPSLPVAAWIGRLDRQVGDDPVKTVEAAGIASSPLLRPSTVLYTDVFEVGRVASAGAASGGRWALSGMPGFALPGLWEQLPAPAIMWCEDVKRVEQLLADTNPTRTSRPKRAKLAIARADDALFTNGFEHERVQYVAPIQLLIDGFSIGGVIADIARREAMSW